MGKPAVLLVDEESAILETTEAILRRAGYEVFTAPTARGAIELLDSQHIDLVLVELIPDAVWVINEANRFNPNVTIAVCTTDGRRCESPLVDTVLYKPLPPPVLLNEIADLLCSSMAVAA